MYRSLVILHVFEGYFRSSSGASKLYLQPLVLYSLDAPEDEQKYRSKHVEQPRYNKLSYTVASCWSFSDIIP
jgi:hypothetical protein